MSATLPSNPNDTVYVVPPMLVLKPAPPAAMVHVPHPRGGLEWVPRDSDRYAQFAAKGNAKRAALAEVRSITGNPRMGWKAVRKWIKRWREK